jgi:hypothetical protein
MKATKTGPDPWVGRIEGSAPWGKQTLLRGRPVGDLFPLLGLTLMRCRGAPGEPSWPRYWATDCPASSGVPVWPDEVPAGRGGRAGTRSSNLSSRCGHLSNPESVPVEKEYHKLPTLITRRLKLILKVEWPLLASAQSAAGYGWVAGRSLTHSSAASSGVGFAFPTMAAGGAIEYPDRRCSPSLWTRSCRMMTSRGPHLHTR